MNNLDNSTNSMTLKDVNGIYFFSKGKSKFFEFSNYWVKNDNSVIFNINDKDFKSSEHAYHYYKFYYKDADENTLEYAEIIRNSATPNDAKLLGGQKLKSGYQSRMYNTIKMYQKTAIIIPNWDNTKLDVMRYVISCKFTQNQLCQSILLSTSGRMLYEDSPYDSFWGVGKDGNGSNWLGKLLVEFRDELLKNNLIKQ